MGARFLSDPETLKKSKAYRVDARNRWRRFVDDMGAGTLACDVTPDAVRRWLAGLELSPISKGNFHRNCSAVFSYALHAELVTDNPFRKVKKPAVEVKDGVDVFTPAEMATLLKVADVSWLPALAIGGFAGVRPEELRRLDWCEVDLKAGLITVMATKSKTRKKRHVTIAPTLAAWLKPFAQKAGRVVKPNERKMRLAAMQAAGIERWPMDVLRHSFASYHVALQNDDGASTANQLGHRNSDMLYAHYRELVKPDAARQWWALTPAKIKRMLGTAGASSDKAKRKERKA